jgi:L-alanine-DL-glutamate epimerase-like enolase superfamily enzyme
MALSQVTVLSALLFADMPSVSWAALAYFVVSVALSLPAALHAVATIDNCPMLEYPYDPPILTAENQQHILKEPITIGKDGYLKVPDKPGLGVEIDEEKLGA